MRCKTRDATLWHYQILTESAYNLVGLLAGLNRLYFTSFQFKKMRRFLDQMKIKPENFAGRLENLFMQETREAALALEVLVGEVTGLVEREMPDVDTSVVRKRLGQRRDKWKVEGGR